VKLFPASDETKSSQVWIYFSLFWKMMTSHEYQGFNIILAQERDEAKNEARSNDQPHSPCRKH